MAGFIFGGNTGTSYDELQRKRAIAEQLMEGRSGPMRPVDGIASAAESITGALLGKKLDKQKSKLDDDWMTSAAAQGLDPQRLAILKELSPQQRNAYMLQRMDAKPKGGPSKSELQAQQANEVLAALFGKKPEANSEYSTGSSPDPSVNKGFTSGENLSFGQPAPQAAGYTPPPVTGPIPESQWGVTDVAQAAIDRAAPPAAPAPTPAAPQPTQGLSFGTPLAVSQDTGQGVTMDQVNELRMTGIMSQNPALLKAADALEKMIPAEPEKTSTIQNYEFYLQDQKARGEEPLSFAEWSIMDEKAGNPSTPTASKERTDFQRYPVTDENGNVVGYEDRVIPGSETALAMARDSKIAMEKGADTINLLDSIIKDPSLPSITGMIQGRLPPMTQAGTDLNEKVKQVQGKAFLEAFDTLKGGGQITEVEGKKATAAIARLERVQSTEAFIEAMKELKEVAQRGMDRARRGVVVDASGKETSIGSGNAQKQSGGVPEGIDPEDWNAMTPEEQALWD